VTRVSSRPTTRSSRRAFACSASTARAQGRVRGVGLQLAPRRDPRATLRILPAAPRRVTRLRPRGRRALPRARARRARDDARRRAWSRLHLFVSRSPERDRIVAHCVSGDRLCDVLPAAAAPAAGAELPRLREGSLPETESSRARTFSCRCGPASRRAAGALSSTVVRSAVGAPSA
jgi:hypothetical protein